MYSFINGVPFIFVLSDPSLQHPGGPAVSLHPVLFIFFQFGPSLRVYVSDLFVFLVLFNTKLFLRLLFYRLYPELVFIQTFFTAKVQLFKGSFEIKCPLLTFTV